MNKKKTHVIVLEDDLTLSELMADGLRHDGHPVVTATTGLQAREALEAAAGDAILLADRALEGEGTNGFQVAADALAQYPQLRVIYISGTHIAVRRRQLGERERALLKPFAMAQLTAMVRELGG